MLRIGFLNESILQSVLVLKYPYFVQLETWGGSGTELEKQFFVCLYQVRDAIHMCTLSHTSPLPFGYAVPQALSLHV